MIRNIVAASVLAAGLVSSGGAYAGSEKFDGTWNVQLITQSGICDERVNATLIVTGGQIQAGSSGVSASGQVGAGGSVSLAVQKGPAQGTASGKLSASSGVGTWNVSSVGCSGRWTAHRRGTTTARAE